MQLNNLVIIPISHQEYDGFYCRQPLPLSPCKNLTKTLSQKDQIPWKKSQSAFKKFKGKKDKENKSSKNSHTNIAFLEGNEQQQLLNKNFCLVDNDINFSLLNSQNGQVFKSQQTYEYFDPNQAPFFQYGVTYQYMNRQTGNKAIQEEPTSILVNKKIESLRMKKDLSKKEKSVQQFKQKEVCLKEQKKESFQWPNLKKKQYLEDPFIIIKASEKRGQIIQSIQRNQYLKKQEYKKNKIIGKGKKHGMRMESVRSSSNYSNNNSESMMREYESEEEEKEDEIDCEFKLLQFEQFFKPMKEMEGNQEKTQNSSERINNLPTYQIGKECQSLTRNRIFENSTNILNEYEFKEENMHQEDVKQNLKDYKNNTKIQN